MSGNASVVTTVATSTGNNSATSAISATTAKPSTIDVTVGNVATNAIPVNGTSAVVATTAKLANVTSATSAAVPITVAGIVVTTSKPANSTSAPIVANTAAGAASSANAAVTSAKPATVLSTGPTPYRPNTMATGKPPEEVIKTAQDTLTNMNSVGSSNFMNAVDPIVQNVYSNWKSKNDDLMNRIQALKQNS
uniref:Uncharacterized protein n=1 Tax=Panagrolaimus superbus TaxID=310955 RepID=A0A914YZK1_9BILA